MRAIQASAPLACLLVSYRTLALIYAMCPVYCSRPLNRSREAAPINGSPAFLKFQD